MSLATLPAADWAGLGNGAVGTISGVKISSPPEVEFTVTTADGRPVNGLEKNTTKAATASLTSYSNLSFSIAKLIPGAAIPNTNPVLYTPSKWVSYIVTSTPTIAAPTVTPRTPTTDATGTLISTGDGKYKYTFYRDIKKTKEIIDAATYAGNNLKADLGDLAFDDTKLHRVFITISGNARGTGTNTADGSNSGVTAVAMKDPINIISDFYPCAQAGGSCVGKTVKPEEQRNIVDVANCNECHAKINLAAGGHTGSRSDTRTCVVCHTDQVKYGTAEATKTATGYDVAVRQVKINNNMSAADFPLFIHRLHRGDELTLQGYNFGGVLFNDKVYPMSIGANGQKMCTKCHTKTATAPQGDNWSSQPSRLACGACHDGIDFKTGLGTALGAKGVAAGGHVGGAKTDDACAGCHSASDIKTYHLMENVTPHNPTVKAGLTNFTYDVNSVTQAVSGGPVTVKFRILASTDGSAAAPVTLVASAATVANPLTGFTGSPGFLMAYAMTQDGVTTPVDYNNLGTASAIIAQPATVTIADLLSTSKATSVGTLSAPDASGYYTATIVGTTKIFPAGAKMRAVALQGYFTQVSPAAARHTISVVKNVTGDTVRRVVVDPAKCGSCHEWFEGHGGNRVYETQVCVTCHVPGMSTTGRGISDASLLAYTFTPADIAKLTLWKFDKSLTNAAVNFPVTSNTFKDMIHGIHAGNARTSPFRDVRDATSRGSITLLDMSKGAFPGILSKCETCHKPLTYGGAPANTLASTYEANNGTVPMTPAAYKLSFNQPNATDIVTSPYTASCVSCHDKTGSGTPAANTYNAQAHMTQNGGLIKVTRAAFVAAGNTETCATCHGAGKVADTVAVHKDLK